MYNKTDVRFADGIRYSYNDALSAELDKRMVITEVDYDAPFDVNDTFAEVLQWHMDRV